MHHCKELFVFNELTVLHDTSINASKRPRNENPTKSPKICLPALPPSKWIQNRYDTVQEELHFRHIYGVLLLGSVYSHRLLV